MKVSKKRQCGACRSLFAVLACVFTASGVGAQEHDHAHHQMTPEQFAELREKVPLYREFTDEEIMANMARMSPNFRVYLSDATVVGDVGVLALGHGFEESGNRDFQSAFAPTADKYPTAVGLGMAMMTSSHIQTAVDELTRAGARKLVVIPATTVETGGLVQQWQYIFGLRDDAAWMSVDQVETDARIVLSATPTTHPLMSAILLDYAKELSTNQPNEVVVLVSHGPVDADANARELAILETHAARLRSGSEFAAVQAFTLQDDAPTAVRKANVEQLRDWVRSSVEDGQRVIVLTNLLVEGSVHTKVERDLAGLDYDFNKKGLMLHPLFSDWVDETVTLR